ncbi:MAG: LuxR C-terminal-related transcriptional regulator [Vulcanimicrobiaceae bacterium]
MLGSISPTEPLSRVTPGQREILRGLAAGRTIGDVDSALNINPNTARVHVARIHRILGVQNRVETLAARRGRFGII